MSGRKMSLPCLVWPYEDLAQDFTPVDVELDDTLGHLKMKIRANHSPILDEYAPRDLLLWKYSSLPNEDIKKSIKAFLFDGSDNRMVCLNDVGNAMKLSELLGDVDALTNRIFIFVKVRSLSECGTGISNSTEA
jgi:hypothetical protein